MKNKPRIVYKFDEKDADFIKNNSSMFFYGGDTYYILHMLCKKQEQENNFEMLSDWELPDEIRAQMNYSDMIPIEVFKDFFGKKCVYKSIDCIITGIPQWIIKEFTLTPISGIGDIGRGNGKTASLSMHEFEREVVCAH